MMRTEVPNGKASGEDTLYLQQIEQVKALKKEGKKQKCSEVEDLWYIYITIDRIPYFVSVSV